MDNMERWPLSAAATALLLNPKTSASTVLKLAIKELVVVGHATLVPVTQAQRWRGDKTVMHLRPGGAAAPDRSPLPQLAKALFASCPEGGLLSEVVTAALKHEKGLADNLRQDALGELVSRGLVVLEKKRLRSTVTRTPVGDTWAQGPLAAHARWRVAVETGGPTAAAAVVAATASPGLVLLMDRDSLRAIDDEVRRSQEAGGDASVLYVSAGSDDDRVHWSDLDAVDGLSGLDAAVDPGVDSGSASDGGDGGGGGD